MAKLLSTLATNKLIQRITVTFGVTLTSGSAWAHTNGSHAVGEEITSAFASGFIHPLTGVDHLIMLIGIGLIAARYKHCRQEKKSLALIFGALFCMLVGFGCAAFSSVEAGFGAVSSTGIELMILASVFVAAITAFLAAYQSKESPLGFLLSVAAAGFLFFHGWAHGLEAPTVSLSAFAPGMLLCAGLLSGVGCWLGRFVSSKWQGALLGVSGVLLAMG